MWLMVTNVFFLIMIKDGLRDQWRWLMTVYADQRWLMLVSDGLWLLMMVSDDQWWLMTVFDD